MSSALLIVAGLAGLLLGADLLVRGGAALASHLGVRPIVIGLTVVALGTSLPELAIGVDAVRQGSPGLAVGNIAGTNLVNILFILGLSALIRPIAFERRTLRVIAIGTSAPELVTTVTSTLRGDRDIAVGNLLGSTVYNVALILGITVLAAPAELQIPQEVIAADLLVLAVVALITVPVLLSGHRISRLEGGAFVAAYLGYLVWLTLA